MNWIVCFGIPLVLVLFVKDMYIKPIPILKKVKEYLLFEKTFLKRVAQEPIKPTAMLVCLYIFIWLNLNLSYGVLLTSRNDSAIAAGLVLLVLFNVIHRALCELFLVLIPNYKHRKQIATIVPDVFEIGKFCGECGTRYFEDATFCPSCGCKSVLQEITAQDIEEQTETDEGMIEKTVAGNEEELIKGETKEGVEKEEV